jgi:branched-subunit amino acid aminotransferase/4-amino-4-deoxychorismate lyase
VSTSSRAGGGGFEPAAILDGRRVPLADARLPVTDAGVARGDGAFETVGVWDGTPFALDHHLGRLGRSLELVALPVPDLGRLRAEASALVDGVSGDAVLRLYVTASGTRLVTLDALPDRPLPVHLATEVAPWVAAPKTMSYLPNMAASRRARLAGADDALLLAPDGTVLEGPTFAVLWVAEGELRAPDLGLGIIDSISRRTIVEAAHGLGVPVRTDRWGVAALHAADEVLAVSSLRDLVVVRSVDDVAVSGAETPVRDELAAALWAARRG